MLPSRCLVFGFTKQTSIIIIHLFIDTQASHSELQQRVETMEVELAEKRLLYSEHIQLDSDEEEEGEIDRLSRYNINLRIVYCSRHNSRRPLILLIRLW